MNYKNSYSNLRTLPNLKYSLLLFCNILYITMSAQGKLDYCEIAVEMEFSETNTNFQHTFQYRDLTASMQGGYNTTTGGFTRDAWYTFIATGTSISLFPSPGNDSAVYDFHLYSGNCSGLEFEQRITIFSSAPTIIGKRYYIRYTPDKTNIYVNDLQMLLIGFTQEAQNIINHTNQICIDSESITIGSECNDIELYQHNFTDSGHVSDECNSNNDDVWYDFIAPNNGTVAIEGSNIEGELYSGVCGDLIYSQCLGSGNTFVSLNAGEKYYMRVTGGNGVYCFKEGPGLSQTNISCEIATLINVGDTDIPILDAPLVTGQACTQYERLFEVSWYKFSAPNSGRIQLSFTGGTSFYSTATFYSGECNSLVEFECSNSLGSSVLLNYLNSNEDYYIKINNTSRTHFSIEALDAFPADDLCSGAISADLGTSYSSSTAYYGSDFDLFCWNKTSRWYSFIAPNSGSVEILSSGTTFRFYQGLCEDLDYISNHEIVHGLTTGDTYYISVNNSSLSGTFSINETTTSTYTNEICSDAQSIAINEIVDLPTQAAVQEYNIGDIGICEQNKYDLWYAFIATSTSIRFSGNQSSNKKQVYAGTCGNLIQIDSYEHYFEGIGVKDVFSDLIIGDTYYIRAWQPLNSFNISYHQFTVEEVNFASSDNNECSDPTIIDLSIDYQTFEFGYDYTYSAIPPPSCNSAMDGYHDAWFKFIAEKNGVKIDPPNIVEADETLVIYSGDCGILEEVFCYTNQNSTEFYIGSLTIGSDYYIRRIVPEDVPQFLEIASVDIDNGTCDQAKEIVGITPTYGFDSGPTNQSETNIIDPNSCDYSQTGNWYSFIGPEEGSIQILGGNPISLYETNCSNLLYCFDATSINESKPIDVVPGEQYYLFLTGGFKIKSIPSTPAESDCSSSIALSLSADENCNQLISGTTINATESTGSFCGSSRVRAVFYNYTAADEANHQISVSNAAASHKIAVYQNCLLDTPIGCGEESLNVQMQSGLNYTIAIYPNTPSVESDFDLCILIPETSVAGSVGVSTDNPQAKLDVNGGIRPGYTDNNIPGNMRWNSDLEVYDGTNWKSTTNWDHNATLDIDMNNQRIRNLQNPVLPTDAVTKAYVDNFPDSDNSALNEIQTLSKSGNTVSLSAGGGSFEDAVDDADNDPNNEIETWSTLAGIPTDIADGDDVDDADNDPNNEIETWNTLAGIPTDIADGDDVEDADNDPTNEIETWTTLAGIPTDIADGDDVEDADNDPTNEIETWATLAGIPSDIADGDDVDDADNDPTNEIETWATLVGIPTDIADGDDVDDADNDPNNEIETWSTLAGIPTDIADGDDVDDADASSINEKINSITLSNSQLTINEAGTDYDVELSTIATQWDDNANGINYNSGKIGLGVTDPTTELDVDGEVQISTNSTGSAFQLNLIEDNAGFARLNFTNTSDKDITLAAIPSATTADSKLNFFIEDAGDVMTITGAERVGINNTSPQSDLHIKHANGATNGGLRLQNTSDANDDYWNFYVSSSNDELRLYANDIKVGDFDFTSGAYSSVSDERMKSGIQPLHFDWSKFMLLNAANYSFLHDANKRQYLGLLAQEVQEIYPELVQYDEEEDTYRLDYSGTGVIAIKAVQELKNENEVLKKKIENLENKLEELIKLMK